MPNIIQQQDLLKGLPDARLAMLLQNPVGEIPPFLVAAEAQRRQAIRQQFAGTEQKESVVDTLTKQMAKVPQNIQSGQMTTPPVPPTPQMQGVMALQQQQAMQQAAQQVMPQQGMRAGGAVQRYQSRGLVTPQQDMSGYPAIYQLYKKMFPGPQPVESSVPLDVVVPGDYEGTSAAYQVYKKLFPDTEPRYFPALKEDEPGGMAFTPEVQRRFPSIPPESSGGMSFTMPPKQTNQPEVEPAAAEDDDRKTLEKLYSDMGPSDWEKAQKWFAASQQFLQPDQTLMQSLVGAGAAFSEGAAEEQRAKRLADIELKKALYELDVAKRGEERDARAARLKARTDIATGQLDDIRREMQDVKDRIQQVKDDAIKFNLQPEQVKTEIDRLQGQYDALGAQLGTYQKFLEENYDFPIIPVVDTATRTVRTPT
jgi:hypothetical protein